MLQKANQNLPIKDVGIHRTQMQKEIILQKLKEQWLSDYQTEKDAFRMLILKKTAPVAKKFTIKHL